MHVLELCILMIFFNGKFNCIIILLAIFNVHLYILNIYVYVFTYK